MKQLFRVQSFLVCVVLFSSGCARIPLAGPSRQEIDSLRARIVRLEVLLADREKELAAVREVLRQKEDLLREKDNRTEQMRRQLESVGIFGN